LHNFRRAVKINNMVCYGSDDGVEDIATFHSPDDNEERQDKMKKKIDVDTTMYSEESTSSNIHVYDLGVKSRIKPIITYEAFMWIQFIVITVVAIVDRFTWNIWPRQRFSIGAGSAGGDRLVGFKPGPWSVVLYDVLARISGRYAIVCYNFLLITRFKSLEYWIVNSFVSRYLLDCSNIVHANNRLHRYTGIGLCVLTLLHVWSILFPCITHGYTAKVIVGVFEWPLSERNPVKCEVEDVPGCWPGDANNELKQMGLQADDAFRLVEMTLFLMILMPLSLRWLATRWHAAIQLHRFINVVYFVDIVRRHSHPHSWVLNTPVFLIYVWDAYIWSKYFRRNIAPEIKRVPLGDPLVSDYMVLYWDSPFPSSPYIAPHYSMIMKDSSVWEEKHIFTCFENRLNHKAPEIEDTLEVKKRVDPFKWKAGCVIRVFHDERKPRLGSEKMSHTHRMFTENPEDIVITGSIPGEMSLKLEYSFESYNENPIVLIGAGSAVNFILDFLLWLGSLKNGGETPGTNRIIKIIYTTRNVTLFQWAVESYASVMSHLNEDVTRSIDLHVSKTGETGLLGENVDISLHDSLRSLRGLTRSTSVLEERVNLHEEIGATSEVFCQGSATFKKVVLDICKKKKGVRFFGGEGGH